MGLKITIVPFFVPAVSETLGEIMQPTGQSRVMAHPDGGMNRQIGWLYDKTESAPKPNCALTIHDATDAMLVSLRPLIEKAAGFKIGEIIAPSGIGNRPHVPSEAVEEIQDAIESDV